MPRDKAVTVFRNIGRVRIIGGGVKFKGRRLIMTMGEIALD